MSQVNKKFINDLLDLIDDNQLDQILKLLKPVNEFIGEPEFITHIEEIATALTEDRNGDNQFTVDDLEVLSSDLGAVGQIVSAIILLIASSRQVDMRYHSGITEQIIRNVLVYIFLVVIPQETGRNWTTEERQTIVKLIGVMYDMLIASKITEKIFKQVVKWFNRHNLCLCCIIENDTEDVIQEQLPSLNVSIKSNANKNRILLQKGSTNGGVTVNVK